MTTTVADIAHKQELEQKLSKIATRDHWAFGRYCTEWFEKYGKDSTNEVLASAIEELSPDAHVSSDYVGKCRRVWAAFSDSKREGLSWTHHFEAIRRDSAKAEDWLDKAIQKGWSVGQMVTEIAAAKTERPQTSRRKPDQEEESHEDVGNDPEPDLEQDEDLLPPKSNGKAKKKDKRGRKPIDMPDPNSAKLLGESFVQEVQNYLDQDELDESLTKDYLDLVRQVKKQCGELSEQLEALL